MKLELSPFKEVREGDSHFLYTDLLVTIGDTKAIIPLLVDTGASSTFIDISLESIFPRENLKEIEHMIFSFLGEEKSKGYVLSSPGNDIEEAFFLDVSHLIGAFEEYKIKGILGIKEILQNRKLLLTFVEQYV